RLRHARARDLDLYAVDEDPAGVRRLIAHDALHERALSRAVLAQEGVEGPRGERERDVVEDHERPESLADSDRRQLWGRRSTDRRGAPPAGDRRARLARAGRRPRLAA